MMKELSIITQHDDATPDGSIFGSEAAHKKIDAYILGGGDGEMSRIEQRLMKVGASIIGNVTTWEGADIANREVEISQAIEAGMQPVIIEHRGADEDSRVIHIDHHGENSQRKAAILQVLERLGIGPNFVDRIIAANDSSYIPGIKEMLDKEYKGRFVEKRIDRGIPLDHAESSYRAVCNKIISAVRRADRKAQGVTEEMEIEGERAVAAMETREGLNIVRIDSVRTSVVTDLVAMRDLWKDENEQRVENNLVVVCAADSDEKEVWFFGPGDVAKNTQEHFRALKEQRIANDPNEPLRRGRYHTVGGGLGFGKSDQIARCLVVAPDSEEVIGYVLTLEEAKEGSK